MDLPLLEFEALIIIQSFLPFFCQIAYGCLKQKKSLMNWNVLKISMLNIQEIMNSKLNFLIFAEVRLTSFTFGFTSLDRLWISESKSTQTNL